jgi:phage terminase small subunit
MPRKSAEALAMAGFLPTAKPPEAPAHLSPTAQRLWTEIVLDRPAEHFRSGTQELLANYCEISAQLEELWRRARECEDDRKAQDVVLRHIARMATLQARLCSELRLTPRVNIDRRSATLNEFGNPPHPLFGGKRAFIRKPWDPD